MAIKSMIFIDGSWMFHNRNHIREAFSDDSFSIDFKQLPFIIKRELEKNIGAEIDNVRTHFFGSRAINKPEHDGKHQEGFFDVLEKECRFEMEIYDIDFRHQGEFSPKEKCVDIALATSMMYYAAIPNAYDIAVLVAGDLDYLPLIKRIRRLGKRTLLVAMSNIGTYYPTNQKLMNDHSLFDFGVLYLDHYVEELRLKRDYPHHENRSTERNCMSCGKPETTDWMGEYFYCENCRERTRQARQSRYY
ncbi:MAG: NYN domain-containing protein [Bernardetiaceae bacterium]|nr:NYN domain-containing protein [Bernardetiaceae bacterium]